jgi:hypothetical protein
MTMKTHLRSSSFWTILLAVITADALCILSASAASKNVWIESPVDTRDGAKKLYRCGSGTESFLAGTSWPAGGSWTWYGATQQGSATDQPSNASHDFTAPEGPCNVTTVYNGEVSFAAIVTAVKVDHATEATTPSDRTRTTIGVCERVVLSILPSSVGSVTTWYIWPTSGAGTLSASSGATTTLTASDTASQPEIYVLVGEQDALAAECILSFNVIPPDDVGFTTKLGEWHVQGTCSAGFHARVTILPTTVSFYNIEISELDCYATATGCYAPWNGLRHLPWPEQPSVGSWLRPAQDNRLSTAVDYAYTPALNPPFSAGTFLWQIPWHYRKLGDTSTGHYFRTLDEQATATADGTCTISKAGMSSTFTPADPTVNF